VKIVKFKEKGASTLGGRDIWYDDVQGRLNVDKRGTYLGSFNMDDLILVIYKDGSYELTNFELTNRYDAEKTLLIEKRKPERPITAIHYDGNHKAWYIKRFLIETLTEGKKFSFISEAKGSKLLLATTVSQPEVEIKSGSKKEPVTETLDLAEFVEVRGWKAIGNKLPQKDISHVELLNVPEEDEVDSSAVEPVEEESNGSPVAAESAPTPKGKTKTVFKPAFDEKALKTEVVKEEDAAEYNLKDVKPKKHDKGSQLKFLF
jgi:topoisomerase-4 subunit A